MLKLILSSAAAFATITIARPSIARTFPGPDRYCGQRFAIDLDVGDRIEIELGPDFMLESLVSPTGGFGLYEGFAPQNGAGDTKVEAGLGKPTFQVGQKTDDIGYVIWTGDAANPFYVHVWGGAFKGSDQDFALLRRLQFGDTAKRGCLKPTFKENP